MPTALRIFWALKTMSDNRPELKVGDKVYHKQTGVNSYFISSPKCKGIITNIDLSKDSHQGGSVQIRMSVFSTNYTAKIVNWFYNNCILIKQKQAQNSNLCSCPIETLMGKGCSCGGS